MDSAGGLKGKGVLITGASSGLGAHFAKLCARHGANVIIGARRRSRLEALAKELPGLGAAGVMALDLDVTQEASVVAAFESAAADGAAIDVVVNNAGIGGEASALDMTLADYDAVMNTNLR
ncbi:MAG TPA: SDR family NAD(P)-dependent oxidoreductase, partial [Vineibacter sp.]|nr:SDR family NAD(P)-dependent oxidoreductase [Vineibacter sp.]